MKLSFSPAARDDLIEIALYIAEDNPVRALAFVDELEARCAGIAGAPGIGTARPELGDGIRVLPHGRYLIFYRQVRKVVRVERVMHSARDIGGEDFDTHSGAAGN
ncbi:MAG: type II toxin-antitoxin system RelE/ParE family toxin [Rubrivivax sp.]